MVRRRELFPLHLAVSPLCFDTCRLHYSLMRATYLPVRPTTATFCPGLMSSDTLSRAVDDASELFKRHHVSLATSDGRKTIKSLLVCGRHAHHLDGPLFQVAGGQLGAATAVVLAWRGLGKRLDARNGAERRFGVDPRVEQRQDGVAKLDQGEQGEPHGVLRRGAPEAQRDRHEDRGHAEHAQLRHEAEPPLDAKHVVKGLLGVVEQLPAAGEALAVPPEAPDVHQAGADFGELRVERRLGLQVNVSHLSRGAEVKVLYDVDTHEDEGYDDGNVRGTGGDDANVCD